MNLPEQTSTQIRFVLGIAGVCAKVLYHHNTNSFRLQFPLPYQSIETQVV